MEAASCSVDRLQPQAAAAACRRLPRLPHLLDRLPSSRHANRCPAAAPAATAPTDATTGATTAATTGATTTIGITTGNEFDSLTDTDANNSKRTGKRDSNEDDHLHVANFCTTDLKQLGLRATERNPLQLFGVFDGHGGDECAKFIAKRLWPHLGKQFMPIQQRFAEKVDPAKPAWIIQHHEVLTFITMQRRHFQHEVIMLSNNWLFVVDTH